ncbi:cell wall elongation regulator TseB-like domain-containing protein [Rummeliibacillus sp. JY-2-4R]
MKNWIKFFSIFLLILSVSLIALVSWKSYSPFHGTEKTAKAAVLTKQQLKKVTDTYVYNGKTSYVTVIGTDSKGNEKAIFVPQDNKKEKPTEILIKKGISKKEAVSIASKNGDVKKILHTKLGIEKPGVVWEITYLNKQDKLNYVYIMFDDGRWWKRILNL